MLLGIDISRWQALKNETTGTWKHMDLSIAAKAGATFVFARATVGNYYQDPTFIENFRNAIMTGLPFGAYHVVVPSNSPESQWENYQNLVQNVSSLLPFTLGVTLDCEVTSNMGP